MKIATKAEQISRMEQALEIAKLENNYRLINTLSEMLANEAARRSKSALSWIIEEEMLELPRTVYNSRRAAIKLKAELYDDRIELEDAAAIMAKREAHLARRKVFARA
jgi:hypothetical protein